MFICIKSQRIFLGSIGNKSPTTSSWELLSFQGVKVVVRLVVVINAI